MSGTSTSALERRGVHSRPLVDGRPAPNGTGPALRRRLRRLLVSGRERDEADLERRLRTQPDVTRANTIALISPKGGVGKTTSTFIVGNMLAGHLKLRAIAVDADPDFGTLAQLAPEDRRCHRSLADLLDNSDRISTAAELGSYVSRLPTGLHILAAPEDTQQTTARGPDRYGELLALLATFYDVVLLDLATGIDSQLARFAIERADQVVLVATPEWVSSPVVVDALAQLRHDRTTLTLNKSYLRETDLRIIEERLPAQHLQRAVTIPYDEQLAKMLDSGTYTLDALGHATRIAIKRLGVAVAERLV